MEKGKHLVIRSKFPTRRFEGYLRLVGAPYVETLNVDQVAKVFMRARSDFMKGILSLDELSSVCLCLWTKAIPPRERFASPLAKTLYAGSELGYYVRKADHISLVPTLTTFLQEVLNFGK